MRICKRCGVGYDNAGEWCNDCIDVEDVVNPWALTGYASTTPEVTEQKKQDIRDLWMNNMSDPEIARYLGIATRTVLRWRQRLGLSARSHGGIRGKSEEQQAIDIARIRAYGLMGVGRHNHKRLKEQGAGWFAQKR